MVEIRKLFMSRADAEQYAKDVTSQYPPQGYGTSVRVVHDILTERWAVVGHRFSSCD